MSQGGLIRSRLGIDLNVGHLPIGNSVKSFSKLSTLEIFSNVANNIVLWTTKKDSIRRAIQFNMRFSSCFGCEYSLN